MRYALVLLLEVLVLVARIDKSYANPSPICVDIVNTGQSDPTLYQGVAAIVAGPLRPLSLNSLVNNIEPGDIFLTPEGTKQDVGTFSSRKFNRYQALYVKKLGVESGPRSARSLSTREGKYLIVYMRRPVKTNSDDQIPMLTAGIQELRGTLVRSDLSFDAHLGMGTIILKIEGKFEVSLDINDVALVAEIPTNEVVYTASLQENDLEAGRPKPIDPSITRQILKDLKVPGTVAYLKVGDRLYRMMLPNDLNPAEVGRKKPILFVGTGAGSDTNLMLSQSYEGYLGMQSALVGVEVNASNSAEGIRVFH